MDAPPKKIEAVASRLSAYQTTDKTLRKFLTGTAKELTSIAHETAQVLKGYEDEKAEAKNPPPTLKRE